MLNDRERISLDYEVSLIDFVMTIAHDHEVSNNEAHEAVPRHVGVIDEGREPEHAGAVLAAPGEAKAPVEHRHVTMRWRSMVCD